MASTELFGTGRKVLMSFYEVYNNDGTDLIHGQSVKKAKIGPFKNSKCLRSFSHIDETPVKGPMEL